MPKSKLHVTTMADSQNQNQNQNQNLLDLLASVAGSATAASTGASTNTNTANSQQHVPPHQSHSATATAVAAAMNMFGAGGMQYGVMPQGLGGLPVFPNNSAAKAAHYTSAPGTSAFLVHHPIPSTQPQQMRMSTPQQLQRSQTQQFAQQQYVQNTQAADFSRKRAADSSQPSGGQPPKRAKSEYQPAQYQPAPSRSTGSRGGANEVDVTKLDVTSMMDVTSYVGFDVREEEERIRNELDGIGTNQYWMSMGQDRTKVQDFVNMTELRRMVASIALESGLSSVDEDFLLMISHATQERIHNILESTIIASKHRVGLLHEQFARYEHQVQDRKKRLDELGMDTQVGIYDDDRGGGVLMPKFGPAGNRLPDVSVEIDVEVVGDDMKGVLARVEKEEREAEMALRKARGLLTEEEGGGEESGINGGSGGLGGIGTSVESGADATGTGKKKGGRKKNKDLPENIKTKLTNQTAAALSGIKYKSWMIAGGATGGGGDLRVVPGGKKRGNDQAGGGGSGGMSGAGGGANPMSTPIVSSKGMRIGRLMTQKEMRRVTVKDALFAMEKDRELRKDAILYKWLANIK
ncbi:transcription initiation factor TFIID component TAF4 family-domain-containing protein [Cladochytrium replicatum]|nr:transcription initiation factor TFIID component TAF4 family-domain-containing protein [Cladochytrium replicatum]